MLKQITIGRVFFVALIVTAAVISWETSAYVRGMAMARVDCARGHYEMRVYGYPGLVHWEYERLLQERYSVHANCVAGCVVDPIVKWYADGYNSVAKTEIMLHFRKDVFSECAIDARAIEAALLKQWDKTKDESNCR